MNVVRMLARPMLAARFIFSGADALARPQAHSASWAEPARRVAEPLHVPLPADPLLVARVGGGLQLAAGLMFATGRMPRLSALVLAAASVPSVAGALAAVRTADPARRREKLRELVSETGTLGALLLASVDTGGKPSLAHRGRDAAHRSRDAAQRGRLAAARAGRKAARRVS